MARQAYAYLNSKIIHNPYQYLPWFRFFIQSPQKNMLISDEVGLGKTIEAGIIASEMLHEKENCKILILCPAFLRVKWQDEFEEKFYIDAQIYSGNIVDYDENLAVTILPISRLNKFVRENRKFFDLIIVDEIHYFKNATSQRFHMLFTLLNEMPLSRRVFLSATPINNSPEDYSTIRKLLNGEHESTNTTKREAFIHLPRRNVNDIVVCLSPEEQKFYDSTDKLDPFSGTVYRHIGSSCLYALCKYAQQGDLSTTKSELLNALEELSDGSIYSDDNPLINVDLENRQAFTKLPRVDSKMAVLNNLLKTSQFRKVVLFSHYIETVKYLNDQLCHEFNVAYLYANQSSPNIPIFNRKNHFQDAKAWFDKQNTSNTTILICSDSCKEGVDLQNASVLINYDLPFNPSILEQRIGRIDRMGQREDMQVYNFHVANTYDDRLHFILSTKLRFINYFAEYGIGNRLNISADGASLMKRYITYFSDKNMSNEDKDVITKVLKKIGVRVSDGISGEDLLMQIKQNQYKIEEWFDENELEIITNNQLELRKKELENQLDFHTPDKFNLVLSDQVRSAVAELCGESTEIRKKAENLIINLDQVLLSLEDCGEMPELSIEDIKQEILIDFLSFSMDEFVPVSILEILEQMENENNG